MSYLYYGAEVSGERYKGDFRGSLQVTRELPGSVSNSSYAEMHQYIGTGVIEDRLQDDKIWFAFETASRPLIAQRPRMLETFIVDYGQDTPHDLAHPNLELITDKYPNIVDLSLEDMIRQATAEPRMAIPVVRIARLNPWALIEKGLCRDISLPHRLEV